MRCKIITVMEMGFSVAVILLILYYWVNTSNIQDCVSSSQDEEKGAGGTDEKGNNTGYCG